ncbi:hypothetical protein C8C76_11532 [Halanaerobium saccharolyticum]|jgi:hypothetical protein|uniref:TubC N-terminal docking domain-containing protein n=1 Tax=Halanaerobium saccharolyticum TaxID=43595 RepID=A0A2T5RJA8_9FIRM|nr:hypothetical protein [Halanaerobium saccharolyticum]PTV98626.1 hypothetical protein C8C76_11532 [Halanaerobium saccharolyticum]
MFAAEIIKKLEQAGYKLVIQFGQNLKLKLADEKKSNNKDEIKHLINELKNNKSAAVRFLKYRYDPRPDLKVDHHFWKKVLKKAEQIDEKLYSNLHGFRAVGAVLQVKDNKLRLEAGPDKVQFWDTQEHWTEAREEYLIPFSREIAKIFEKVAI